MAKQKQAKLADKVLEFLWKHRIECINSLHQLDEKRKKNHDQGGSYAHWASWNFMSFIHEEFKLGLLKNIIQNIEGGVKRGFTDEDLVNFLKEVRDSYVNTVMSHRGSHSTSAISNLIEEEKINVYRSLAGTSVLNSGSLKYLLSDLGQA